MDFFFGELSDIVVGVGWAQKLAPSATTVVAGSACRVDCLTRIDSRAIL
jgi:hypothetical protein